MFQKPDLQVISQSQGRIFNIGPHQKKKNHDDLLNAIRKSIPDQGFDDQVLLQGLREGVEVCPFNRVLGLQILSLAFDDVCVRFDMKDELIGSEIKQVLHGGVISSVLDVTGSITAAVGVLKEMEGRPLGTTSLRQVLAAAVAVMEERAYCHRSTRQKLHLQVT